MTTGDMKSMTVEELAAFYAGTNSLFNKQEAFYELARRLEEAQQKIVAQEAKDNYVGRWLSAALDDPSVCEEMKADIGLWMASDATALAAHDAEVAENVIKAVQSTWPVTNAREFKAWLDAKAAEYRAKAKGEKP